MSIKVGDVFWCIAPDTEAEGYGDHKPRKPWRGMITEICTPHFAISHYAENGNVDDDTNATAYVLATALFEKEEDAKKVYDNACRMHLCDMLTDVLKFMAEAGIYDLTLSEEIQATIEAL